MESDQEGLSSSQAPANACTACRHRKRRCDRTLPSCSTCSRVGRFCIYDEDSVQLTAPHDIALPDESFLANLRQPTVDVHMRTEALRALGSLDRVHKVASMYFASTHHKLAVISEARFYERLPILFVSASAEFTTLCLCMHLIQQSPSLSADSVVSSLYITAKASISLLEATGCHSLDAIQCRLLLVLYEMGHGVYPAASISIGACARAARNLGLHQGLSQGSSQPVEPASTDIIHEERRRTWWAVHNLDRFINLYGGDAIFASEDADKEDPLPTDDRSWSQNVLPDTVRSTISTPAVLRVGQFARECQVSHLVGRVVRHVFDPVSDASFRADEAAQLERTLMSFLPILTEEELKFRNYCGALAMCLSALFTLYASPLLRSQNHDVGESHTLFAVEALSTKVAQLSGHLLGIAQDEQNEMILSPYVPYALYQTAVMQLRLWKERKEVCYKEQAEKMVTILKCFNKRWRVAGDYQGKYLAALTFNNPPLTLPPQGFYISNEGLRRIDPI